MRADCGPQEHRAQPARAPHCGKPLLLPIPRRRLPQVGAVAGGDWAARSRAQLQPDGRSALGPEGRLSAEGALGRGAAPAGRRVGDDEQDWQVPAPGCAEAERRADTASAVSAGQGDIWRDLVSRVAEGRGAVVSVGGRLVHLDCRVLLRTSVGLTRQRETFFPRPQALVATLLH